MQFEITHNSPMSGEPEITFSGSITAADMIKLQLDRFDRMLLDDTGRAKNAADLLLGLEMLFRRGQEQGLIPSK